MMLALIEYDKKGNSVVVKSPMETTHEGWIERGKIADEAMPFKAKYTELERFNTLHTILLLTHLECLKSVGQSQSFFLFIFFRSSGCNHHLDQI